MANLRIQLFGGFHLLADDGQSLPPLQARAQSLLAYLILHRETPQARQHLAFQLWPDSDEDQAFNNLRKTLFHLRSALPDAARFLRADARTVQWLADAPCTVDVIQVELEAATADPQQWAAAASWYKGDLLPGCYDDWIAPERERLREQYIGVLGRLIDHLEQTRNYPAAIQQANSLLRTDPLHEETHRRLMRLHALQGDRAAALRTYHTCATTLLRELGVDPSPPTQETYARLLHLDLPPAPPAAPVVRAQDVLVGRKAEWRALLAAWQECAAGRAHFVVIAGEAGAGKTRLTQEFTRWVERQGNSVVSTRAYAGEEGLAYAPIIEWLHSEPLRAACARLEPVWIQELARLAPDLLPAPAAAFQADALGERWQRQRLFAALLRAFLLIEQPLALIVDDLQWCDQETLEWLHHLLRSAPTARLLVLGAVRADEIDGDHPLSALLLHLHSAGQVTEIDLSPLSADETAELARQIAEHPLVADVVVRLYQTTEGNPLFIAESVRALLTEGSSTGTPTPPLPTKVHAVILQRLARLSSSTRELANLAAVIGRSFTLPVLGSAAGVDEDTLVRGMDELWQRRIVREQGADRYDFSHDLIRETAYASVSSARRRLLHRRVAEALEGGRGAERPAPAQVAWHYEQAGLYDRAVAHYSQAAATAQQMYAFQDAISYLDRALDLLTTLPPNQERLAQEMDLLSALGAAWSVVKTYAAFEAKDAFDRALALSRGLATSPRLFVALWGLHEFHLSRSEYRRSLEIAEQCLQIAQDLQDPALLVEGRHAMWGVLAFMNQYHAAVMHVDAALQLYRWEQHHQLAVQYGGHDPGHCGLSIAAVALCVSGHPQEARRRLDEAIELARHFSVPSSLADAAYNQAMIFQLLGDLPHVHQWGETTIRLSSEHGYHLGYAMGAVLTGWAKTMNGDHAAGLSLLEEGMAQWRSEGIRTMQTYLNTLRIEAYCRAGRIEEGIAYAEDAHDFLIEFEESFYAPEIYRLHGDLLLWRGRQQEAEGFYRQGLTLAQQQGAKMLELRSGVCLARLWQAGGKPSLARDLLAPICAWFHEGDDTPDLHAARELLDALTA